MTKKCSKCGKVIDYIDTWTGKDGGLLCHDCWEKECDDAWWEEIESLDLSF